MRCLSSRSIPEKQVQRTGGFRPESVHLFPPLLPILHEPACAQSFPPALHELRVHHGTVWCWNRAIYDPQNGGHLRIELRALPAGPTVKDMVANAAFIIGLTEGLRPQIEQLTTALPFHYADYNFYRAAKHGLQAQLIWPDLTSHELTEHNVCTLTRQLLPIAKKGLLSKGISEQESHSYLSTIEARIESQQNGSSWQIATVKQLEQSMSRQESCEAMLKRYMELSESNLPVAQWSRSI